MSRRKDGRPRTILGEAESKDADMSDGVKYRVTVRSDEIELRGRIDGTEKLVEFANAVDGMGLIVIASPDEGEGGVALLTQIEEAATRLVESAKQKEEP